MRKAVLRSTKCSKFSLSGFLERRKKLKPSSWMKTTAFIKDQVSAKKIRMSLLTQTDLVSHWYRLPREGGGCPLETCKVGLEHALST